MQLANGESRFAKLEEGMERLLKAVEPIPGIVTKLDKMEGLFDTWENVQTGGRFMVWLGKAVKWTAGAIAVIAAATVAVSKAMGAAMLAFVR